MYFKSSIPFRYRFIYGLCQFIEHFLGKSNALFLTKPVRKILYKKLYNYFKSKPEAKDLEVIRIPRNNPNKEIKQLIKKRKPFIIDQGALDWECVKKWDFDYLSNKYGSDEIIIDDYENPEKPHQRTTLKHFLRNINNDNSNYFRFYPFLEHHPERTVDINFNWIYSFIKKSVLLKSVQVFIGPNNSYTSLHNAYANNFFVQIEGNKNWILYHWKDSIIIDPDPVFKNYRAVPKRKHKQGFNPFKDDYSKPFELYKYIPKYLVSLKPGDIFYNPSHVWHAVKNDGKNIGFGFRWVSLQHSFFTSPLYFLLDLCVTKPTFFKSMKEGRKDFNQFNIKHIKHKSI